MSADWFDGVSLTVEIGFDSSPSTALGSTTWTDVSAYVRALEWRYGRTSETDGMTPGVASVVLDNRDRRFDPDYTSSPYNGKVLPMRRIRIRATYAVGTTSQTFSATGAVQDFVVPDACSSIDVTAYGAQGGGYYFSAYTGGKGARLVGTGYSVTPGETLKVRVGSRPADATGGYNGGGAGGTAGAFGGGGMTDIRRTPYGVADALCVAAGGGGAASVFSSGAVGGYTSGGSTSILTHTSTGGTQSAGGTSTASAPYTAGTSGSAGTGGAGADGGSGYGGGGGGAGYYGGAGGVASGSATAAAGGAGGSSYSTGHATVAHTNGNRTGDGAVTITYLDTVVYDLWSGFVEAWPQTYWQDADAIVTVPCVDASAVLAVADVEANAVESAILALDPTGYYPFDDASAVVRRKARRGTLRVNDPTRVADQSGNGTTGSIVASGGAFDAGYLSQADSLVYGGQSLRLGGTIDGYGYNVYAGTKPAAGPVSMSLWFSTTAPSGATSDLMFPIAQACADDGDLFRLSVFVRHLDDTGSARVEVTATHTTGTKYAASAAYTYGAPCFVGASVGATGTPVIVIDGVSLGASSGFYPGVNNGSTEFGRILGPGYEMDMTTWTLALTSTTYSRTLTVDEWGLWAGTKLTAAELQGIYTAGRDARDNERSGSRVGYVLDAADWPSADRSIEDGESWLGPLAQNPGSALVLLNDIANAEQGRVFVAPNGKVTFQSRTHDADQTSAVTLTDTQYVDVQLETSRATIRNRVSVVQESTGSTYVSEDSTSQAAYLRADETLTVNAHGGTYCSQLAAWLLARYKDPQSRITSLRFLPRKAPATLIPQALGRTVGDLVTVTRTPQGVGSAISKTLAVEGVAHRIDAGGNWEVDWYLSPGPNTGPWLTLGDATLGKIGATDGNKLHL